MQFATVLVILLLFGIAYSQTIESSVCADDPAERCFALKDLQCVGIYEQWARIHCKLRCGYCPDGHWLPCNDTIDYCDEFGERACQTDLFGEYMRQNCRKTCTFCTPPSEYLLTNTTAIPATPQKGNQAVPVAGGNKPKTTVPPTIPTKVEEWCVDDPKVDCWNYEDSKCLDRYTDWAKLHCPFRCGYCPNYYPDCIDTINYCDEFGDNSCETKLYGTYMRKHCRKNCQLCHYPAQNMTPVSPPNAVVKSTIKPAHSTPIAAGVVQPSRLPGKPNPSLQTLFPILPTGAACQDQKADCTQYLGVSCVGIFKSWAMTHCARTCGYCDLHSACIDFEHCEHLPLDICTNQEYKTVAETSCRKFCGFCKDNSTTPMTTNVLGSTESATPANRNETTGECSRNFTDIVVPDCCNNLCACNDTISGHVTDAADSMQFLKNVTVFIDCHCQNFAVTDGNGYFSISGICLQGKTLRFELPGYRSQLFDAIYNGTWIADPVMESITSP